MTPQELWDAAITLENDGDFYKKYTNSPPSLSKDRRERIIPGLMRCKLPASSPEDREQLRRYLDDVLQLPSATHGLDDISQRCAALDTIEFWKDEVRFPTKEVKPEPGALYWKHTIWQGPAPKNHGAYYAADEIALMLRMFSEGYGAPDIAAALQRKHNSIAAKLKELELLSFDGSTNAWHVKRSRPYLDQLPQPSEQTIAAINSFDTPTQKETIMTASIIEITTKTLINGIDIATMSDSQLYSTIANQEDEIKKLEKIENKPKRLVNEIDKRKAGIRALVSFLDAKEAPTT